MTLLRSNQYKGLESFAQVGTFVPLTSDTQNRITREVAPARFSLALPEPTGAMLEVAVALIRDLRACRTDADREDGEQASPRLIPIITTDPGPEPSAILYPALGSTRECDQGLSSSLGIGYQPWQGPGTCGQFRSCKKARSTTKTS